jgi:hypothetical protein
MPLYQRRLSIMIFVGQLMTPPRWRDASPMLSQILRYLFA